jgi:hypothetical protein
MSRYIHIIDKFYGTEGVLLSEVICTDLLLTCSNGNRSFSEKDKSSARITPKYDDGIFWSSAQFLLYDT